LSEHISACIAAFARGPDSRASIHEAVVRRSSASAFGLFHGSSASMSFASSFMPWSVPSNSSQSAADSSAESRLPPITIGASASSSSPTSRKERPNLSA
jgi:hypothetical protein